MRWILYLAVLGAALLVPLEKNNVGALQPMEAIYLTVEEDLVVLKTDTGDFGVGVTLPDAVLNMHETTPGIVYLDTADFLILNPDAKELLGEMKQYVKPTVRICMSEDEINIEDAAAYLAVHKPETKLKDANEKSLRILTIENGKFNLKDK